MLHVEVFPKMKFGITFIIFCLQQLLELHRELMVKIHMTTHIPSILSPYRHIGNIVFLIGGEAIFISRSIGKDSSIITTTRFFQEHILCKVIIGRAYKRFIQPIKDSN